MARPAHQRIHGMPMLSCPVLPRRRLFRLSLPLAGAVLAACAGGNGSTVADDRWLARPAQNRWPTAFEQADPAVQEAYRYALANPDLLRYFPCYCGCVEQGHTSNRDCFIKELRPDGSVLLDPMSFG